MMFQGGALLDSMTVFDNLAFPLREHTRAERSARSPPRVRERLDAVGLHDVDELLPSQLSGGMVKRVALARAIITQPVILLCDEPFSGLDPISARRIEALLVEHQPALRHHDRGGLARHRRRRCAWPSSVLVLLPDGAVQGTPAELQRSADPRVASFLSPDLDAAALNEMGRVEALPSQPLGSTAW